MKKTVSMMLAIIIAAVAICTLATSAFAQNTSTTSNINLGIPDDDRLNETTAAPTTTKAPTTTAAPTTAAPTTTAPATAAPATTAESTTEATTAGTTVLQDIVGTLAPGQTAYEGQENDIITTTKPATTKKPAANVSTIPSTGSSTMAPVIALFALASIGTAVVVKSKKEN